jgi:hypothetical protein
MFNNDVVKTRCFAVSQTGYYVANEFSVKCAVIDSWETTVTVTQRDVVFLQTISSIQAISDIRIGQGVNFNAAFNLIAFEMGFKFEFQQFQKLLPFFLQ